MNKHLNTMNNKVLVVTSLFPPSGGPGVKRILQFIKYLQPLGWESVVLTHKYCFMGHDDNSLKFIPQSTKVYRTFSPRTNCSEGQ